jgi:3-oxoacyl-[acyl-carrier-protein] synthase II
MVNSKDLRRVVITGIGAITPLGNTFQRSWQALLAKESGISTLEDALHQQNLSDEELTRECQIATSLPCQVAAAVKGEAYDSRTARFVHFALRAGGEAMTQANLVNYLNESSCHDRVGVCVGSGMSSAREIVDAAYTLDRKGLRRISPHFVPKVLTNSAAGRLSIEYKLQGPCHAVSTACAAGAHAIGDAMRFIQFGDADVMLAGGAEACIDPLSLAGFTRLRAMSNNPNPDRASRPFDAQRDGFVMGEGAAILILEELEHAKKRGIPILAELCGYGLSGDAYHITSPDPQGNGAKRAMFMSLRHANIHDFSSVNYVNAHATSTPMGDDIEARAIDSIFGANVFVSGTKGATGHLLGAAGAVEAAFTIQAILEKIIPPTRNLESIAESERVSFQHVQDVLKKDDLNIAMSNSFGFGGTNVSLTFKSWLYN